eukprot:GILJ01001950.1.p1 GENE.GILJ01001950.1~~GILJ01001950.1.p1  ORF type:complete len:765 (-),score=137.11 GILJ01001950.1:78-2129(-)
MSFADIYGGTYYQKAQVDQWLDFIASEVDPVVSLVLRPLQGAAGKAVADSIQQDLDKLLRVIDSHLQNETYLVGQGITLADISLAATLFHVYANVFDVNKLSEFMHVGRWFMTIVHESEFAAVLKGGHGPGQMGAACPVSGKTAAAAGAAAHGDSMSVAPQVCPVSGKRGAGASAQAQSSEHVKVTQTMAGDVVTLALPNPKTSWGGRTRVKAILGVNEGLDWVGQVITVNGWAKTTRAQGATLLFIQVNDGSCLSSLQVVLNAGVPGFEEASKATTGASLSFKGVIVKSPAKGQSVEMHVSDPAAHSVKVFGQCEAREYPMSKKGHTMEHLRENAHLRPRSNTISAVARVRNALAFATHNFFQARGFLYVHTPLITASDCEGAGELFQVTTVIPKDSKVDGILATKDGRVDYTKDFFGKQSFLTVSGQLSVENYCVALSDVYTFGPTFRAEDSHTSRHLAEFWMIEPEMAFAELPDDMICAESYLKFCIQYALDNCLEDLQFFEKQYEQGLVARLRNVVDNEFARCSYTEAVELIRQSGKNFEYGLPDWGTDLQSEHERYLAEEYYKKPVIVYNYPKDIKAFYMKLNPDGRTVAAMDILVPKIGEVIGGSQREDNLELLDRRIEEMHLEKASYWWYRDLRKYGSVPHAGFGLGFERLIMMVTGMENIRDVIPFPRWPGHADF